LGFEVLVLVKLEEKDFIIDEFDFLVLVFNDLGQLVVLLVLLFLIKHEGGKLFQLIL
jgi:hypothetical protein